MVGYASYLISIFMNIDENLTLGVLNKLFMGVETGGTLV